MKSNSLQVACIFAFIVILFFSIQRIHQWLAIRRVLGNIDERAVFIQSVPKSVTGLERIAVIDKFVKAFVDIDASNTPKDFREAFEAWKGSWIALRDKLASYEYSVLSDSPARREMKDASARLDKMRYKYGFRAGSEPPTRSIAGQLGDGLISFGVGEYLTLMGFGALSIKRTQEEKDLWLRKWGPWAVLGGIGMLAQGMYQLYSGFT